jgi:hypothetical protein
MAARDARSHLAWHRRRAIALTGYGTGADLPVPGANLEGADHSQNDERRAAAARRLARDAAARHWWRRFVEASDAPTAFAAWTLFRRSADRRALAWLANEAWPESTADALSARKTMQFGLNERALTRELEKREKDLSDHLFGKRISANVAPWYRGDDVA